LFGIVLMFTYCSCQVEAIITLIKHLL
jgi:hypothetical protein